MADEDADLTAEQLQEKYAQALQAEGSDIEDDEEDQEEDREDEEDSEGAVDIADTEVSPMHAQNGTEPSREDGETEHGVEELTDALPELEEVDAALLDDSEDSSIDSDEDMDSEIQSESRTDVSASEGEETDGEDNALLGFFGTKKRKELLGTAKKEDAENEDKADTITTIARESSYAADGHNEEEATTFPADTQDEISQDEMDAAAEEGSDVEEIDASESNNAESAKDSGAAAPVPIKTKPPFLLRGTLREYQHHGLDWLAGLHATGTNGILADEMGLGKTIQTISLLAHLAVDKGIWGPHLVVVPTSVILNWEMEFKKFLPGFKVLSYYGTQDERMKKRKGWLNDDLYNVVVTSYQMIINDSTAFKRRHWYYLILDEAHNIKNFQTARWQTMLT
ncbi:hypothetical protein LTS18_014787, partial [Coniosporium uncinatum]